MTDVKVKHADLVLTPSGQTFMVKCGSAMANPHLLTQRFGDLLLH